MKLTEIPAQLERLGFSRHGCVIGDNHVTFGDDFTIEREGDQFLVCDLDRNIVTNIRLQTEDEAQACAYFLDQVVGRSRHLVTSKDKAQIEQLQSVLEQASLEIWRNDILTLPGPEFPQFRIFVSSADYRQAKDLLAENASG